MKMRNEGGGRDSRTRSMLIWPGVAVLVFGLLLWARFLLVTGHPRTAVADPPVVTPQTQTQAAADKP